MVDIVANQSVTPATLPGPRFLGPAGGAVRFDPNSSRYDPGSLGGASGSSLTLPEAFSYSFGGFGSGATSSRVSGTGTAFTYGEDLILDAGTVSSLTVGDSRQSSGAGGPGYDLSTSFSGLDATVARMQTDAFWADLLAGDDTVLVNLAGRGALGSGVVIETGTGNDRVTEGTDTATFAPMGPIVHRIDLGAGNDVVELGRTANRFSVTLGSGADVVR